MHLFHMGCPAEVSTLFFPDSLSNILKPVYNKTYMINKLYALACVMLIMITSCKKPEPVQQVEKPPDRTIIIGLIPEQQIFEQVEKYTPLADYLSVKTGVKIELKVLPRYSNIMDKFVSQGLDGAFFG